MSLFFFADKEKNDELTIKKNLLFLRLVFLNKNL